MKIFPLLMLSSFLLLPEALYAGLGDLGNEEETFSPVIFCEEVQKHISNNSPVEKTCGSFKTHQQETAIATLCENFVSEYQRDPAATIKRCNELGVKLQQALKDVEEGEALDLRDTQYIMNKKANRGFLSEDLDQHEVISPSMESCQEMLKNDCSTDYLETNFAQFAKSFPKNDYFALSQSTVVYNEATCKCFTKSRGIASSFHKTDIEKEDKEARERISDIVEKNLAKKLINEFANNLERAHFYKVNPDTALSSLGNDPNFSCTNTKDYSEEIKKACKDPGMSKDQINDKISRFLDAYEEKKSNASIEDKLKRLQEKVLNTGKSRDGTLMDRVEYDKYRYANAATGPENLFIQELLRTVLADKEMSQYMTQYLDEKRPAWVLSELMTVFSEKKMEKFFRDFSVKHDVPDTFKHDLSKALAGKEEMKSFRSKTFEIAIDDNPSLKVAMGNKELFQDVLSSLNDKTSLMDALEKKSDKLKEHYIERCGKFQKKFAEVICTPKEKYLEKMNRNDMKKLLQANLESFSTANMIDQIMCDLKEDSGQKGDPFSAVAFTYIDRFIESDYVTRMKNKEDNLEPNDRYSLISRQINSGNKSVEKIIENSSNYSSRPAPMSPSYAVTEDNNLSSKPLPQVTSQTSQEQMMLPNQANYQHFASTPAENSQTASNESKEKSQTSRSEESLHDIFRNFFNEESQKNKVDDHFQNISEADYKELQRLQEQIARGRVELNELAGRTQQEKIKSLEEKLTRLENEKKARATSEGVPAVARESAQDKFIGNTPQFQSGGFTQNRESSALPITSSSSSSPLAGSGPLHSSASGSNAVRAPAGENKASETSYTVREASGGDLVITSSRVHNNNLRSEDLSAEVIDFVKKQKPDLKTLKKLMDQGLILKLKVVQNGTEIQKEFKVNSNNLTPEAKNYLKNQITLKEYQETKRQHSFASLKYLLGIKMQSAVN